MKDYSDFPPITLLRSVLASCPQAALLFIKLWDQRTKALNVTIQKSDIKPNFLISCTIFHNQLLALSRRDILKFRETIDFFIIELHDNTKK